MQHTHTHKAVTGGVEAKKLPSRRRQSNYSKSDFVLTKLCISIIQDVLLTESCNLHDL